MLTANLGAASVWFGCKSDINISGLMGNKGRQRLLPQLQQCGAIWRHFSRNRFSSFMPFQSCSPLKEITSVNLMQSMPGCHCRSLVQLSAGRSLELAGTELVCSVMSPKPAAGELRASLRVGGTLSLRTPRPPPLIPCDPEFQPGVDKEEGVGSYCLPPPPPPLHPTPTLPLPWDQ